ncbi:hypothetical protein AAFF_G00150730 [Aldrovandia affinis]|uniref:Uncharacterized protein n=1 Tax=Aldrovandia affinis TaxID=143900 RepID=A0AAD7RPJ8_9TELE|nr:hypothetical protein AAFF_G00150730 [Aldrovandia affinis]
MLLVLPRRRLTAALCSVSLAPHRSRGPSAEAKRRRSRTPPLQNNAERGLEKYRCLRRANSPAGPHHVPHTRPQEALKHVPVRVAEGGLAVSGPLSPLALAQSKR